MGCGWFQCVLVWSFTFFSGSLYYTHAHVIRISTHLFLKAFFSIFLVYVLPMVPNRDDELEAKVLTALQLWWVNLMLSFVVFFAAFQHVKKSNVILCGSSFVSFSIFLRQIVFQVWLLVMRKQLAFSCTLKLPAVRPGAAVFNTEEILPWANSTKFVNK